MTVRLIDSLATTEAMADLFSDGSIVAAMLEFEVALARAEARLRIIPQTAADAIAASAQASKFDFAALAHATLRAGTPAIPLVKALTEHVRKKDADAARFVHWGATSQDVADTAISLLLKRAQPILCGDVSRLTNALAKLAERHKQTVMLGRTLLQGAPPVTFGLKAAGWLGAVGRGDHALRTSFAEAAVLQFGGASGTLASLGDQGEAVASTLAEELALRYPDAPWHTQRDRWARLICDCGVLTGSLGKMARDISLLMQMEVDEAAEPGGEGRGGSSTMPHKRNPIACSLTLAAAHRVPGLVASYLSAMVQEHERGVGGWQAEWPIMSAVLQSTGLAVASMAEVAEGLSVDAERMRANIEKTNGVVFAERAMMLLGWKLGRDVAHKLLEAATRKCAAEGRHLQEVLAENPEISAQLDRSVLQQLEVPEQYLGSAEDFRKALLSNSHKNERE
ncbi:MAG: 3-carboxy-cis,cis-muconate cycloisomerase [Candidatus Sulfotelmatobacter sp.]|jgi:3-carboxy-cis,cis-muconate cycloisomerase